MIFKKIDFGHKDKRINPFDAPQIWTCWFVKEELELEPWNFNIFKENPCFRFLDSLREEQSMNLCYGIRKNDFYLLSGHFGLKWLVLPSKMKGKNGVLTSLWPLAWDGEIIEYKWHGTPISLRRRSMTRWNHELSLFWPLIDIFEVRTSTGLLIKRHITFYSNIELRKNWMC